LLLDLVMRMLSRRCDARSFIRVTNVRTYTSWSTIACKQLQTEALSAKQHDLARRHMLFVCCSELNYQAKLVRICERY
jgi:hypothetical protein